MMGGGAWCPMAIGGSVAIGGCTRVEAGGMTLGATFRGRSGDVGA